MGQIVILNDVIARYSHTLYEARAMPRTAENPSPKPRFGCTFIMMPNHPAVAEIEKAALAALTDAFGEQAAATKLRECKAGSWIIQNGDRKASIEGFEGMVYVAANAAETQVPVLRDADGLTALSSQNRKIYDGAIVRGIVDVYWNAQWKKLLVALKGAMFLRDGTAFKGGAGPLSDEYFAPVGAAPSQAFAPARNPLA
jgi:hypothetical protein